jgi:bacterial/archaeal transporter family protein
LVINSPKGFYLTSSSYFDMANWLHFSLLALITWGFWGFFPKLAVKYIDPKSAVFYEVLGAVLVGLLALALLGFKVQYNGYGVLFAILTGVAALLGGLFYLYALSKGGSVSVVVVLTALYPLITIALASIILKEPVSIKQGVGMFFALAAIILMSV